MFAEIWRQLTSWAAFPVKGPEGVARDGPVERPWRYSWDHLPKRTAGPDFSSADYVEARERAQEVARATLGEEAWEMFVNEGHVDVPSGLYPGVTYRIRPGRRIEVVTAEGASAPWPYNFLCVNPTYPLPEVEFLAHLYLYARDREELLLQNAAPQPWDQRLGRTF